MPENQQNQQDTANPETSDTQNLSISEILTKGKLGIAPLPEKEFPLDGKEGEQSSSDTSSASLKESAGKLKKQPKYKSIEEAEKAYREAERKMTEATTRAKELEREVVVLKDKVPKEISSVDPVEEIAKATQAAINALEPQDPKYNDKVLSLLAKQSREISEVISKQKDEETRKRVDEKDRALKAVSETLAKEGLSDFENEFWNLAPAVPSTVRTVDGAIQWGIDQLNALISKIETRVRTQIEEEQTKEREGFTFGGGTRRMAEAEKSEQEPQTLTESLKKLRSQRIIK
jgi:hypothetical protein